MFPFSSSVQWAWSGQWALNAWQNFAITIAGFVLVFVLARRRGYSPVEMFSAKADAIFVETIRRRFPLAEGQA